MRATRGAGRAGQGRAGRRHRVDARSEEGSAERTHSRDAEAAQDGQLLRCDASSCAALVMLLLLLARALLSRRTEGSPKQG